jgi:putative hemolysin
MNAPGHAAFWLREHCRGLTNPNLAPREHMTLVAVRPMLFGIAACAACCAGCATHKNDQTREIERTAGNYCQSKGQRLVITTAGDSEVFNCVPDAPGTSGNAGIGAAKPLPPLPPTSPH